MGLKTRDIAEPIVVPAEPLAEWYADLVRVGAKKIIVFTHASTLFTVIALDVHRQEIRSLAELLLSQLQTVLTHLEYPKNDLETIARLGADITYASTADRRILGSMNELIRSLKFYVEDKGGIENSNAIDLSMWLSEILLGAIDYEKPIDRFRTLLEHLSG
jgi:hypothetical protein